MTDFKEIYNAAIEQHGQDAADQAAEAAIAAWNVNALAGFGPETCAAAVAAAFQAALEQ